MTKNIDFTNCPRLFDRAYNGANGKKIAVVQSYRAKASKSSRSIEAFGES